jgi:acyl-homoserine-lactone acylase
MRPVRRWLAAAVALILLAGLAGPAAAAAAAKTPARLSAEVLWDRYGVPHVYGADERDIFYGFGWAQMKSHANLVLTLYAEGRGRAAEYYGCEELASDRWMAINDVPARAQAWLAAQSPAFRADLEAFAAGMNAYGARHPEALSPAAGRVLPITAADVIGYAQRLFQYVYIAPQSLTEHLPPDSREPAGSNGWVIAPSRSADGKTLMLMNPHLPWGPGWSTYYEAQLAGPGVDLYGATQIGLPVLRFVFSDQLGITNTVDNTNGVTLYRITPAEGGYRFDGAVKPFDVRRATLKIVRPDGGFDVEALDIRSTVHGPVVAERDGAPIAMRVAGLDRPHALEQYWRMETARDFAGYQAALRMMQVPTFNILYGDRDGHIEYLFNGLVPRHGFGDLAYWKGVVPGDTARTLWSGYLAYDELPKVIDPSGGAVQNSNDPPWDAGFPVRLDPTPYRAYIAADQVSLRMARGIRMLAEHGKLSFEQLLDDRWSTRSELADRLLPDLIAAANAQGGELARRAAAVLANWDRSTDADSRGSLLFLAWSDRLKAPDGYTAAGWAAPYDLARPLTTPAGFADPRAAVAALEAAARDLTAKQGALDAPWSSVMRFKWAGLDLPASGGPGRLGVFHVIDYAPENTGERAANFGSSFAAVVDFASPTRAKVLMSYGNSSQPGSPHAGDQLPLLAAKRMRDAWRTRAEVEANLESRDVF